MPTLGLGIDLSRSLPTVSVSGRLDAYHSGLAGAWSIARRLLSSHSGPLIRVRRSSDNAETDVGYDAAGALDTAALLAFTSSSSGWVTTIYDQSGLARDLAQSTAAAQRRIVNAGSVVTLSGEPAIEATADNAQGYLYSVSAPAYIFAFQYQVSVFAAAALTANSQYNRITSIIGGGGYDYEGDGLDLSRLAATENVHNNNYSAEVSQPIAYGIKFVAALVRNSLGKTLTIAGSSTSSATSVLIGCRTITAAGPYTTSLYAAGTGDKWQAQVIYGEDKTADVAAIRMALS